MAARGVDPVASDAVIGVLVVDDEALVRSGLTTLLAAGPDLRVVGEAADGELLVPLVRRRPDMVLMDVRMPRVDGITATADRVEHPDQTGGPRPHTGRRRCIRRGPADT